MALLRCAPSSTVAQRQSNRLLTDGFLVRIQAVEPQCLATRGVLLLWAISSHFFHNRHDNESCTVSLMPSPGATTMANLMTPAQTLEYWKNPVGVDVPGDPLKFLY